MKLLVGKCLKINTYREEKDNITNTSRKENVRNFKAYLSSDEVEKFTENFITPSYIMWSKLNFNVNYNTEAVGYKNKERPWIFNWGEFDDKFKNKMLTRIESSPDSTDKEAKLP